MIKPTVAVPELSLDTVGGDPLAALGANAGKLHPD